MQLKKDFAHRQELIDYVAALAPWAQGSASTDLIGGAREAYRRLELIDPINYGNTRNYHDGKITRLSPYITHGILDLNTVRNHALGRAHQPVQVIKFIQELAWRDYWRQVLAQYPHYVWQDAEAYKTGWQLGDYADVLPDDIQHGQTGVAVIDAFVKTLIQTGYLHNHARMYVASYVVHYRRVKWQAGARWFLAHLLDGDVASNNLSWQWIANTFAAKPYIFNLENVAKYFGDSVDTRPENNAPLHATYEELEARLFPNRAFKKEG